MELFRLVILYILQTYIAVMVDMYFSFWLRYEVQAYEKEINVWFSNAIGRPCTLLRYYDLCLNKSKSTDMCRRMQSTLNFSNEAQFLLISEESISDLNNRIKTSMLFYYTVSVI